MHAPGSGTPYREVSEGPGPGCKLLFSLAFSALNNNFLWVGNYIEIAFALNKNYA